MHIVQHSIMVELGASSKLNAEWAFLTMLRDEGRKAAQAFLARTAPHRQALHRSISTSLLEGV